MLLNDQHVFARGGNLGGPGTSYFKNKGVSDRVKIQDAKTTIPFDGFSYYEIQYKGDMPPELLKAYEKMNELNADSPRIKYRKEHKKALNS